MCGIAGVFLKKPDKRIINKISRMEKILSHRGPDSSGSFTDKFIKLHSIFYTLVIITIAYFPKHKCSNWITLHNRVK